jgi:hypothetical protein
MLKTLIEIVEIQLFYASLIVLAGGYLISPYIS